MRHDLLNGDHQELLNQSASMRGVLLQDCQLQCEVEAPCSVDFQFWTGQLAGPVAASQRWVSRDLIFCLGTWEGGPRSKVLLSSPYLKMIGKILVGPYLNMQRFPV